MIATSIALAALSRLPYAGLTLHVAPEIPENLRIYMATAGILGTLSPEAVSTYRTLTFHLQNSKSTANDNELSLKSAKHNLLNCLKGFKQILLTATLSERNLVSKKFNLISQKGELDSELDKISKFIAIVVKKKYWEKNHHIRSVKNNLFIIRHFTATVTTTAALCSQFNNACLTKLAFDYFAPPPNLEILKWTGAILCTLTLSYTSMQLTYKSAIKSMDSLTALWGNKQSYTIAEAFYPKTEMLGSIFAGFWAACLYGIVYETTAATIDISKNYGIVLFAGNFIASFFLISYIMKRVIGNGIKLYAESRFADKAVKEGIEVIKTLENAKALLEKVPLEHLDALLQQIINRGLLSPEIKEVLSLNSSNEQSKDLEKRSQIMN